MEQNIIAKLSVKSPSKAEQIVTLSDGQTIRVGRDVNNEIVLDDSAVSRVHASVSASQNGVVLADLTSTNGSFVNGDKVTSLRDLASGDVIDIGTSKITVTIPSAQAAESLRSSTRSRAMTAQLKPLSVTVLVTSIKNYRAMSSEIPMNELSMMLTQWAQAVRRTVEVHGGTIDKVVGKSVVALWMGDDPKDLAACACKAALELKLLPYSLVDEAKWAYQATHPWEASIVVSSGHALTGVVGAGPKGEQHGFTILGDPINLAFGLEESVQNVNEELVLCNYTADLVRDGMKLTRVSKVKVKSEEEPVEIFTVQQ